MYAAKSGCPEYVKLLLDFGADVNIQEVAKGYTALYLAVMAKSLDVCTILVEAGARIDVRRGMHKITAFHRAAMDDQVEICALFAERGDVCVADGRGNYPLDLVDSPRVRKHLQSLSHRKPRDLPADPLSPVQVAQSGIHATGMFVVLLTTERL
jgi:ankyrin repeat protein